jgi:hypothetical protein
LFFSPSLWLWILLAGVDSSVEHGTYKGELENLVHLHIICASLTNGQKQLQFLGAKNMAVVSQPVYSPDLASSDLFLLQRMKLQI